MSWADASRSFFNGLFTEMNAPAQSRVSSLGYDIVTDVTKRKQVNPNNRSEDVELLQAQRQQLVAQSRDSMRNFAIARWAIGKHLDFVSRFSFSCQTRTSFDSDVQKLMDEYANEPKNCDITGRHTLDRIVRMTEARAVLDGDHLLSKLSTGHLQQIETDRLRGLLGNTSDGTNIHGVELDPQGRALSYKVWKRMLFGGYTEPVDIPADQVLFHAYYPNERADQVRGIGLITAGLSDFIDAYEWKDITKAVAKLRTAFGIIFTSNGDDGIGETTEDVPHQVLGPDGQLYTAPYQGKYKVDLGKAPFKLELDPGEDAKFLTDMSPSTQTFEFFKSTIGFALKSLDIPLCFYDEGLTNFFGQRAALILYLESCKTKRRNLIVNVLRPLTRWLIVRWIAQGRLKLPPNGKINDIPFNWHPAGMAYWNPVQEVSADIQQIQAGLATWEDIYLARTGRDWFADMLRRKEQTDFLEKNGIVLDPQIIQIMQFGTDPSNMGENPLAGLPKGMAL